MAQAINPRDPFEQFIRSILSQHNQADNLREIASRNMANFGVCSNIDSFFESVETQMMADQFLGEDKITDVNTIHNIINKLMHLIKKIKNSKSGVLSIDKEKDIKTIKKFMYIVLEEQRNINTDFIDFVNSINKRY